MKSPILALYLEPFKAAAAEGAALELRMRLLAGTVPALAKYAHQKRLEDIEDDLAKHFGDALSADEKETLRLCRQLRNKVLHTDFRAARDKLKELRVEPTSGGVVKIDLSQITLAELTLSGIPALIVPDIWLSYDLIAETSDGPVRISVKGRRAGNYGIGPN